MVFIIFLIQEVAASLDPKYPIYIYSWHALQKVFSYIIKECRKRMDL